MQQNKYPSCFFLNVPFFIMLFVLAECLLRPLFNFLLLWRARSWPTKSLSLVSCLHLLGWHPQKQIPPLLVRKFPAPILPPSGSGREGGGNQVLSHIQVSFPDNCAARELYWSLLQANTASYVPHIIYGRDVEILRAAGGGFCLLRHRRPRLRSRSPAECKSNVQLK